jgi:zinc transport system substrate-binding protein
MKSSVFRMGWMSLAVLGALATSVHAVSPMKVFVSILPQKSFVEQIGGARVAVSVMVAPGAGPHTYEPKPRQMAELVDTVIYFAVGAPFENAWLPRIISTNPALRVVHTDRGIAKIPMAAHPDHEAQGGHSATASPSASGDHDHHQGLDPHVWLAPPLVLLQGRAILGALQEVDPTHGAVYEANFEAFRARVENLDAHLRSLFAARRGAQFLVFHPAWGYFAHAYGLEQVPIEVEGKDPKPAQLQEIIAHAQARDIRVVFVQPQFSSKSAAMVARGIGGRVVAADPLAEDWEGNLRAVGAAFQEALR